MDNKEIIKVLAKLSCKKKYWETFSRYIAVLDNYLQNKPLSRVEKKNHPINGPRKHYLELLATGFKVEVNFSSPLFEDRIDLIHEKLWFRDDSSFYLRFFRRLQYFRENNLPINETTLDEMVAEGSVSFKIKYKYEEKKYI